MMYKGRGAVSNPTGRYNPTQSQSDTDEAMPAPQTVFYRETAKSIISRNQSPDVPFEQSINPYRGCEHGCIYCFARPNHAYVDLSPGLDFETRIFVKENAAQRLQEALQKQGYKPSPITLGTATDPYQPVERHTEITRELLTVLVRFRHPFTLITKSALVLRDIDVLKQAAELDLVKVMISVTTLNNRLKGQLEPRTASGAARLRVVSALTQAGIPVGVLMAPLIPWLNDGEVEDIVNRSAQAGAESANYIFLRLPLEVAPLFSEWLAEHYPQRAERVLSIVRQSRGGRLYSAQFGERMRGQGPFAELFNNRFRNACRKAGIQYAGSRHLSCDKFSLPFQNNQLALF
ncbi:MULTISPECIES: PA0069 family radical SAM protein [unclassified Ketobacter]|uniref:PA0069 family radical SAM protein n=1 Tax=unclassified Ketobacter TaxID=2639109 RepID=UPI000F170389|nr:MULTISPECIES: PA0069 family radical SAM protein [unclassified Ketobacter]MCK5790169.1 PA0069 family radical SAM protein [Ketobacter sp.]MEC8810893.1 PA0069 family radical SAM protein [Pseudomonadota bacterium]RLT88934.1 MAG: PA0069 family radical SAM protein [Ketobacter sp. GenoA1]RLT97074.1 MAG: PA0069 family radical SAM protein [Ketobacter sp.]